MRRTGITSIAFAAIFATTVSAQSPDWKTLSDEAVALYKKGDYAGSEVAATKALDLAAAKGEGPQLTQSRSNLATVLNSRGLELRAQKQPSLAEAAFVRALELREKSLGPDHQLVATSLNNLAALHREQKNYAAAEPLYLRALAIREKAMGADHPDVAVTLNNLAALYDAQDQYEKAEDYYRRALAIREKSLGPAHLDVASTQTSLAELYMTQRKFEKAEPLLLAAFDTRRKLPEKDADRLATQQDLWTLYVSTGRYNDADQYELPGQSANGALRRAARPGLSPKGFDPTVK